MSDTTDMVDRQIAAYQERDLNARSVLVVTTSKKLAGFRASPEYSRVVAIMRMLVALVGLLAVASCIHGGGAKPATTPISATPQGSEPPSNVPLCVHGSGPLGSPLPDAFYQYQPVASPSAAPGDLICSNEIMAPPDSDYRAWALLYWARSTTGGLVPVSAVTAISTASPAPLTGRPILSWAHGTPASLTDGCAPSRGAPGASYPLLLRDFLDGGYAVVATDYIGLGTPGVHPYLVGKSEASAVVSAARAAENFSPLQASGPVIIAGHSQGGHAALWADGMAQAPSYVSGLDVRGVIALAPPTDLVTIAKTGIDAQSPVLRNNINFLLAAGSWHLFYNLDYPPVLTDAGVGIADAGANPNTDECYVPDLSATGQWVQGGPLPDSWITALRENSPEPDAFPIPLLIVQGYVDQQVPFPVTLAAVDEYCEHGATITFRGIRTGNHLTPLTDTSEVAKEFEWAQQRIRGETPGNTCPSLLGLG